MNSKERLSFSNTVLMRVFKYYKKLFTIDQSEEPKNLFSIFLSINNSLATNDSTDFYIQLSEYFLNILQFLSKSEVNGSSLDGVFYQYTSKEVLESITVVTDKDESKESSYTLRLYNSNYMNDPKEGEYLIPQITYFDNKSNAITFKNSNIYLASLSKIDPSNEKSLPMWNAYGQNHKGVSLGLKISSRKNMFAPLVHNGYENQDKTEEKLESTHVDTGVYKVIYDGVRDKDYNFDDLVQKIKTGYKNLVIDKKFGDISPFKEVMQNYLDKIRFLYKPGIYSYEQEVRIIKEVLNFEETVYDDSKIKLYTTVKPIDALEIELSEVSFGTKFNDFYLWPNRISKQLASQSKTNIIFRKITFPYR